MVDGVAYQRIRGYVGHGGRADGGERFVVRRPDMDGSAPISHHPPDGEDLGKVAAVE